MPSLSTVNSWCGFSGDLEEVWLGDVYPDVFYEHFSSPVRDAFCQIAEWTRQDLAVIERALERHGVTVRRPKIDRIEDFMAPDGRLLRPPISPRDNTLVIGDHLRQLGLPYPKDPWQPWLDLYASNGSRISQHRDDAWSCIHAPCVVRMGRDIFVDYIYHDHVWGMVTEPLVQLARDFRVHVSLFDGHSDCVFCPLEAGLIISTEYKKNYSSTYPGWEIYWLADNPVRKRLVATAHPGFYQWHVPGNIAKPGEFADHIAQHAQDWVGDAQETVFDVNLLKINDHTVFSVGEDQELFDFLHNKGYNVEVFDFRCKTFWDSGVHCLTSDIRRSGSCPDIFPDRGGPALDWLIDEEQNHTCQDSR